MDRKSYTDGLRAVADWLDSHPDVPLPQDGQSDSFALSTFVLPDHRSRETLAAIARALPGFVDKQYDDPYFALKGTVGGIHLRWSTNRDAVCERVVVGQRTVSKEVPVAYEEQEVVEDVVEWRCDDGIMQATDQPGPDEASGVVASELESTA